MHRVLHRQAALVAVTAAGLLVSLVAPPFPREQTFQHVPTVVGLALLAIAARRAWFTTPAFACLVAFCWLHLLGARYIYSCLPYDAWCELFCGRSLSEVFGWRRNHYDRLVHMAFGGLCYVPAYELARIRGRLPVGWARLFAFCLTLALSAIYEVGEWLLTIVVSPAPAQTYNGQQGDFWDAQKDLALALAGSLAVMLVQAGRLRLRTRKYNQPQDCLGRSAAELEAPR